MLESKQPNRWFERAQFIVLALGFALTWSIGGQIAHRPTMSHRIAVIRVPSTTSTRTSATVRLTAVTKALSPDCSAKPCIALTFDDGPNPIATPIVLRALEHAHVHATFFVVGSRAVTMPWLLQRMHRDGDEIGNHSWSHPDMTKLTADQVAAQFQMTQGAVMAAGVPAPTLFRPPYGFINDTMRTQIHVPFILWDDDPTDWKNREPAPILATAESEARPGAIIDLHDIYTSTGAAVPQLISDLSQHYQLVTVSQLLNLQPGQTGEFFARP